MARAGNAWWRFARDAEGTQDWHEADEDQRGPEHRGRGGVSVTPDRRKSAPAELDAGQDEAPSTSPARTAPAGSGSPPRSATFTRQAENATTASVSKTPSA